MVYESIIEETIVALLHNKKYDIIEVEDNDWLATRKIDEFINEELLKECIAKINKTNDENIINRCN